MTPKDKAIELHKKFKLSAFSIRDNEVKRCALICIYEILDETGMVYHTEGTKGYWKEVKQEIQKL